MKLKNDENFAKNLSSLGDIYINDAFSCSHRKQTSSSQNYKIYKKFLCRTVTYERNSLTIDMVLNNKKPTTCIIGGSKISTKIGCYYFFN